MSVVPGPIEPATPDDEGCYESAEVFVYGPLARARVCFFCGNELTEPCPQDGHSGWPLVMWHGEATDGCAPNDVFLHPACASLLGQHLISDAIKARKARTAR